MIREYPDYLQTDVRDKWTAAATDAALDAVPRKYRAFIPKDAEQLLRPYVRECIAELMSDRELQTVIAYNLMLVYQREAHLPADTLAPVIQALSHTLALIRAENGLI